MYKNPILNNERIYLQSDLSYDFTKSSLNDEQSMEDEKSPTMWEVLKWLFNCIKSLFTSSIITTPEVEVSKPIEESTEIGISSVLQDSDLEILEERIITNDYHLLHHNEEQFIKENSILIEEESFQEQPLPAPKRTTSKSSQQLKQLALKNLKSQKSSRSSQYGTNLSIAKPIRQKPRTRKSQSPSILQYPNESQNLFDISPVPTNYQQSVLDYYIPSKPKSINNYSILDDLIRSLNFNKITSAYEQSQSKLQDLITKKRLASVSKIKPLNNDQLVKVQTIWSSNPRNIIIDKYSIELSTGDLQTLQDGRWLNDNVIDFYFNILMKENPKVFGWTTHFYSTLNQKGYQGVQRWAKRKKLNSFEKDKILVPVNISNTHWALSVIDNIKKTIVYYDSLSMSGNPQAVENLKMYMDKEAERLGCPAINYKLISHIDSPQQQNGSDCGVFTCTAAKYISKDEDLNYSQKDMKLIRRRMVYEMISDKFLS
ncbi:hypothetical protein KGF54_004056 [Candida jiufengensis]|uniref:uncharacterized protein n=1 Tax=Candida jiufengensis TaxID=497108 RepID=UPI0022256DC0|nr:uncharacterized protein KGF54_004056 [Candida jiufengensis]KAI5950982.1 hypothetical protein KGF54_004056 [Candida jiufengensis]